MRTYKDESGNFVIETQDKEIQLFTGNTYVDKNIIIRFVENSLVAENIEFTENRQIAWSGPWSGDRTLYVELTTDQHTTNLGGILSFGMNISSWAGSTSEPHLHLYYPVENSRSRIEISPLYKANVTQQYRTSIDNTNEIIRVACSANGLCINGQEYTSTDIVTFLTYWSNITTMYVGSQEGINRYTGTYNEIRSFDRPMSVSEMQNLTANGYIE